MIYSQSVGCLYHVYYNTFKYMVNADLAVPYRSLPALCPALYRFGERRDIRRPVKMYIMREV